jgi:riboflavin synthase
MFTGIIEAVGRVVEVRRRSGSSRISVASRLPIGEISDGDSVAVEGACLTVTDRRGDRLYFDAVAETLARTTLRDARPGRRVNMERSVRLGGRLDGHLVQGHVDGVAPVLAVRREGDDRRLRIGLVPEIARFVAVKGSITLQGVSLTVTAVDREGFEVALVPYTLEWTNLGDVRRGDRLNVEADLLARYLERILEARDESRG